MDKGSERKGSAGRSVLLVEDDDAVREMIKEILALEGYTVSVATNGEEAREYLAERVSEIDIMITDIVMPKMNGKELGRHCRATYPDLPILYMSGYVESRLSPEKDLVGNTDFIAKPFRPSEFLKKIGILLQNTDVS